VRSRSVGLQVEMKDEAPPPKTHRVGVTDGSNGKIPTLPPAVTTYYSHWGGPGSKWAAAKKQQSQGKALHSLAQRQPPYNSPIQPTGSMNPQRVHWLPSERASLPCPAHQQMVQLSTDRGRKRIGPPQWVTTLPLQLLHPRLRVPLSTVMDPRRDSQATAAWARVRR